MAFNKPHLGTLSPSIFFLEVTGEQGHGATAPPLHALF